MSDVHCGMWNALWYGMHYGLACIGIDMHCDMDDEDVVMSTPGGDCADRPPGACGYGYEYAGWRLCEQTPGCG